MSVMAAPAGRIIKVLPQYLDQKGRHALDPSLYERDAYQLRLRQNPKLRKALRFAVQWKAPGATNVLLRVEARAARDGRSQTITLEQPLGRGRRFSHWDEVVLKGEAYQKFGELSAWRATLWQDGAQLAEQKSFLWD